MLDAILIEQDWADVEIYRLSLVKLNFFALTYDSFVFAHTNLKSIIY